MIIIAVLFLPERKDSVVTFITAFNEIEWLLLLKVPSCGYQRQIRLSSFEAFNDKTHDVRSFLFIVRLDFFNNNQTARCALSSKTSKIEKNSKNCRTNDKQKNLRDSLTKRKKQPWSTCFFSIFSDFILQLRL